MKRFGQWLGVLACLSLLGTVAVADNLYWTNALVVTAPFGTTSSLENPFYFPNPMAANYLRLSVSQSCPINILQFGLWGESQGFQRIPIHADLIQTETDYVTHESRYIYRVNYGQPIVIREIGLVTTAHALGGCQLLVDEAFQSLEPAPVPSEECGMSEVCSTLPDVTQACEGYPMDSTSPIFQEDATPGEDNACLVKNRLEARICQAGFLPSHFQITCH